MVLQSEQNLQNKKNNDTGSPLNEAFARFVNERLRKWHVCGVAVSVVDGGNTWAEGFGLATLPDTPVTSSTLFYAGSTTKAHVAAVLAMMIESGKYTTDMDQPLSWTSPISSLLRQDFVLQDRWATEHLTLEDALCHRTGLPRHDNAIARSFAGHPTTLRDVVQMLRHLPPTAEPRAKWQYNNMMFKVLSYIIESLTGGKWLGDVLKDWLWEPLGLHSTYFSREHAIEAPEHFAAGYYWDENKQQYGRIPYLCVDEISGAGAVISNVEDYARWMRFWIDEDMPISKAGHAAIKAPRIFEFTTAEPHDTPSAYALGWRTGSYRGHRWWFHSGGVDAYGAETWIFPKLKFGVTTLANSAEASNAIGQELVWHLVDNKLQVPQAERWDWTGKWERRFTQTLADLDNAVDILYPNRASPSLPPTLPLEKYKGTYFHPAYQDMTIEVVKTQESNVKPNVKLIADRRHFTWRTVAQFEHISAENWIMHLVPADGDIPLREEFAGVKFCIGADGNVVYMVVEWRSGDAIQGQIKYDKVK